MVKYSLLNWGSIKPNGKFLKNNDHNANNFVEQTLFYNFKYILLFLLRSVQLR